MSTDICRQFYVDLGSEKLVDNDCYILYGSCSCWRETHNCLITLCLIEQVENENEKQSAKGFDTFLGATLTGSNEEHESLDWLQDEYPGEPGVNYPIYSLPTPDISFR